MNKTIYFFLILFISIQANAVTVTVGPVGCDYSTIQNAIDGETSNLLNIRVVQGIYDGGIIIDTSEHETNQEMSLTGGYADCDDAASDIRLEGSQSTIDGDDSLFGIKAYHNLTSFLSLRIQGIKIINGQYVPKVSYAGGMHISGQIELYLIESEVSNSSGFNGGGIFVNDDASIYLKKTMVLNNNAIKGGGLYCQGCYLIADIGTGFSHNDATESGGGVFADTDSEIYIYSGSADPQANNQGIHANTANYGGGIYSKSSVVRLFGHLEFDLPIAYGDNLNPVSLSNNSAQFDGGGIYATDTSSFTLINFNIVGNEAGVSGAGMYIGDSSNVNANAIVFTQNGNCWNNNVSQCSRFLNNRIANGSETNGSGGAIKLDGSKASIGHTWFEGNDAGGEGNGSVLSMVNSNFLSLIENSVFYHNGYVTGSDNTIFHILTSNLKVQHISVVDNSFDHAVFLTFGGPAAELYSFEMLNSIVHNDQMGDILEEIQPPPTHIFCNIVHNGATLPNEATYVIEGDPMFVDRAGGLLQLSSDSELAVDKCPYVEPFSFNDVDLNNNPRFIDVVDFTNTYGEFDYADFGAYEFLGFDDLIFKNSFE